MSIITKDYVKVSVESFDYQDLTNRIGAMFGGEHRLFIERYLNGHRPNIEIERTTGQELAVPSFQDLEKMAAYYNKKYQIDIQVVKMGELRNKLYELKGNSRPTGLIVAADSGKTVLHVVPLLCLGSELLVMDSMGAAFAGIAVGATCFLEIQKVRYTLFYGKTRQQADGYSCRTYALVTLRNALRDLKLHPSQSLKRLLAPRADSHQKDVVDLPATWTYTSQFSSKVLGDAELVPAFSKKRLSVRDLRARCEERHQFTYSFPFTKDKDKPDSGYEAFRLALPPGVRLIEGEWYPKLVCPVEKTINVYLLRKGWRINEMLQSLEAPL